MRRADQDKMVLALLKHEGSRELRELSQRRKRAREEMCGVPNPALTMSHRQDLLRIIVQRRNSLLAEYLTPGDIEHFVKQEATVAQLADNGSVHPRLLYELYEAAGSRLGECGALPVPVRVPVWRSRAVLAKAGQRSEKCRKLRAYHQMLYPDTDPQVALSLCVSEHPSLCALHRATRRSLTAAEEEMDEEALSLLPLPIPAQPPPPGLGESIGRPGLSCDEHTARQANHNALLEFRERGMAFLSATAHARGAVARAAAAKQKKSSSVTAEGGTA